jgi:RecJ-like exonuclease
MQIEDKTVEAFRSDARRAAELISSRVDEGGFVHVVSHLDADGLAAAGIIGKALLRLDANFRIRIQQWVDQGIVTDVTSDNPALTILADMGSGYLNVLSEKLTEHRIVILDHHQPKGDAGANIVQVNPHVHAIDGSRDVSGAGVAYFMAKELSEENRSLAAIAVVGALGDRQDKYERKTLGGLNREIVDDAIDTGYLQVEKDLLFFGRESRPIHKALAYTTSPFIPGISGEEDKSTALLLTLEIKLQNGRDRWRALRDLSETEKRKLCSALSDHMVQQGFSASVLDLIGSVYTLTKEEQWTPMRDAREFSLLLNATGRLEKAGLGVALCMGDRGAALEEAEQVLIDYRRTITKYLSWLMEEPGRIEELEGIYVVRGGEHIKEKLIGTLSSILSTSMPNLSKPIIAYAVVPADNIVKISARTLETLTSRGLDLGEILRVAAERFNGEGGGHNIAAGAQLPLESVDSFIKLANQMIKDQVDQIETES